MESFRDSDLAVNPMLVAEDQKIHAGGRSSHGGVQVWGTLGEDFTGLFTG